MNPNETLRVPPWASDGNRVDLGDQKTVTVGPYEFISPDGTRKLTYQVSSMSVTNGGSENPTHIFREVFRLESMLYGYPEDFWRIHMDAKHPPHLPSASGIIFALCIDYLPGGQTRPSIQIDWLSNSNTAALKRVEYDSAGTLQIVDNSGYLSPTYSEQLRNAGHFARNQLREIDLERTAQKFLKQFKKGDFHQPSLLPKKQKS